MSEKMNLSFLSDVTLEVVSKIAPAKKLQIIRTPGDNVDLRVFSNGKVYPSQAFATEFNLEYQPRVVKEGVAIINGNGLDVFNSVDWGMIAGKLPTELIFVSAVAKDQPKVDMWGSTKYNEDHTPKASVLDQGAQTFGKNTLVPMIEEIYGNRAEDYSYIDFKVAEETIESPNGVYHLPKKVAAGKHKGENTYIRRENISIHPLVIVHVELPAVKEGNQTDMFKGEDTSPKDIEVVDAKIVEPKKVKAKA